MLFSPPKALSTASPSLLANNQSTSSRSTQQLQQPSTPSPATATFDSMMDPSALTSLLLQETKYAYTPNPKIQVILYSIWNVYISIHQ